MGIFSRSRANTANGISQPVLTFSDAAPRDDLQSLRTFESSNPRPRTAKLEKQTGTTTSNGRLSRQKSQKNVVQAFDFTITQPPEGPLDLNEPVCLNGGGMDSHAIGIALGSPSMVPPQYHPREWSSPPSERQDTTPIVSGTGSLRRKPSKWRKIGGMLIGRQNEEKNTREKFYQVEMNKPQDETVRVIQNSDYEQPIVSVSPQFHDDCWEDNHQKNPADSLLTVNIPTVQMERYSVMFHDVLGEKPSSNLLARRSKALNRLYVNGMKPGLDERHKPQRRATSPSTNRSSTFTLFPGVAQNKNIINGQYKPTRAANEFAPRSPVRSNTFPRVARINKHDNNLTVPDLPPALSTGASSGFSSAEPSPIPINIPVTTARNNINPKNEPVWEMITTRKASSGSLEGTRPSTDVEASPKPTSTPTMTTPLIPQEQTVQKTNGQRAKPATRPSLAVLPPRKASLLAYADKAKPKARSNNGIQEDNHPLLLSAHETNASPVRDVPKQPQLQRSQTMPLPLNFTKKTSTQTPSTSQATGTTKLHPNPSSDSLLLDASFSSSITSPMIPQTLEISIARSVSLSRRIIPKQTLVPLGPNTHAFFHNENERFGELMAQKRVPVLIDISPATADGSDGEIEGEGGVGGAGHRYQKSQDIVIESA
ncbi:hypothetical protein TMatcc_010000 [Talaromyces marneffei ATCC 18224]|uniref:Uncharacterized protein n=1 Tax=Talaromyces marneffei (strain ATCC 18224 / CBS 334.59 / QM 7333) TaxID=441960 RepID=B6QTX4_TALMQ|nr:uncharacterized protein EYB26_009216 [Talaromyces marneffei]EEA19859.1 conserved hypothetical protein [Talaromyces marneffei ATCC 18224]QGA21505.1 hypothetical protein EYB26_009216 [Talaromyces marneffei]